MGDSNRPHRLFTDVGSRPIIQVLPVSPLTEGVLRFEPILKRNALDLRNPRSRPAKVAATIDVVIIPDICIGVAEHPTGKSVLLRQAHPRAVLYLKPSRWRASKLGTAGRLIVENFVYEGPDLLHSIFRCARL